MFSNNQINSVYYRYGVSNIAKSEDFVHIVRPDKSSKVYECYENLMQSKIEQATAWLNARGLEYTWNERIDGHLYRLCIPDRDLLFDFECYPVINMNYNYVRINYNTDIIDILEKIFPKFIIDTDELNLHYNVSQKEINKFLRENGHNPVYDKNVLRLAWIKDSKIYQCFVLSGDEIKINITRKSYQVRCGTFMLLRYLNEMLCLPRVIIKDSLDNSYVSDSYQIYGLTVVDKKHKKKIWWSPQEAKWHVDYPSEYVPLYFTEKITYAYTTNDTSLS